METTPVFVPIDTVTTRKCYRSNQPEVVMPELLRYQTVQRWIRQQKKKSAKLERGGIPYDTMSPMKRALGVYTAFHGKSPDELLEDAKASIRLNGTVDDINDSMDIWWETSINNADPATLDRPYPRIAETVARQYYAMLKGFYKANGIVITAKTPSMPTVRKNTLIPDTAQIKAMCTVAPVQHSSWILANNYLGLRITAITGLMVEDFQTENWDKNQPLYPVFISKQLSGFFDYTTWIGHDAMELLRTYFRKEGFKKTDYPWNYDRGWLNKVFKRYGYLGGVIPAPLGLDSDGIPLGLSPLHTHTQRMRRQTLQESVRTNANWIMHLLGHKPPGSDASYSFPENCTPEDLYNEVLKVLPKLEVFGHHPLSPTTNTVELEKLKLRQEVEALARRGGISETDMHQIVNSLKHVKLISEIDEVRGVAHGIQNLTVTLKQEKSKPKSIFNDDFKWRYGE